MKVAFIGTHGVGKTTLCYELAAALKRRDLTWRWYAKWRANARSPSTGTRP